MTFVKKMQQIPTLDRPREKLVRKGAQSLSDFELLEVLIGNGNPGADVSSLARHIQRVFRKGTDMITYETLAAIRGVGPALASKIMASLELSRRYLVHDNTPLLSQQDILARLHDIRTERQEHFIVLSLDGGQRLITQRTVTIGTIDTVIAHPREVFADAIADRAASIVIAHNHPSGEARPSQRDITLTQQLAAAGQLLGVTLRDHIIVTKSSHYSCRQHHLL
jgi:DNA repair protein RadC